MDSNDPCVQVPEVRTKTIKVTVNLFILSHHTLIWLFFHPYHIANFNMYVNILRLNKGFFT